LLNVASGGDHLGMPAHGNPFGDLMVGPSLVVPAKALGWNFSRSSGPGGQGVNTADSRVELSIHLPALTGWPEHVRLAAEQRLAGRLIDGTLTVKASEHRQQVRNREAARARMAALLRAAVAPEGPKRRPTRPSAGARQRRLDTKRRRSEIKQGRRLTPDQT
jgi:ribosome-associated protein